MRQIRRRGFACVLSLSVPKALRWLGDALGSSRWWRGAARASGCTFFGPLAVGRPLPLYWRRDARPDVPQVRFRPRWEPQRAHLRRVRRAVPRARLWQGAGAASAPRAALRSLGPPLGLWCRLVERGSGLHLDRYRHRAETPTPQCVPGRQQRLTAIRGVTAVDAWAPRGTYVRVLLGTMMSGGRAAGLSTPDGAQTLK